jgi:hypothetical protein
VMMVCAAPRMTQVRPASVTHDRLASWVWVTRDHWLPVRPGPGSELTPAGRAPGP